jgi:hypothetical protein
MLDVVQWFNLRLQKVTYIEGSHSMTFHLNIYCFAAFISAVGLHSVSNNQPATFCDINSESDLAYVQLGM